jgi:hypothetical protein
LQANTSGNGDLYLNSTSPIKSENKSNIPKLFFMIKLSSKINILKTKKVKITHGKTAYLPPTKSAGKDPAIAKIEININDKKIRFNMKSFFLYIYINRKIVEISAAKNTAKLK